MRAAYVAGVEFPPRLFFPSRDWTKRLDTWLRNKVPAVCMALATMAPAYAQKSADTLRITWREAIPNLDPYYNSQRTGMIVAFQVFDCLVYRDPMTMEIEPALASSWGGVGRIALRDARFTMALSRFPSIKCSLWWYTSHLKGGRKLLMLLSCFATGANPPLGTIPDSIRIGLM